MNAVAAAQSSCSLAIGLGANLGDPIATLVAVRPLLGALFDTALQQRWSPLFRTEPVGGPPGQPDYLNAVLLVEGEGLAGPELQPLSLLHRLQALEQRFGRQRREHWGPRLLDLDLLWCGAHRCSSPELSLPHPRLAERSFVLAPLAAIDPALQLPPPHQLSDAEPMAASRPVAELLQALLPGLPQQPPQQLPPRPGWPE